MPNENSSRLSPPQYTYYNYIKHSIGNDPCVNVADMKEMGGGNYVIPIHVQGHERAVALATILELHKSMGNLSIDIEIFCGNQMVTPSENTENSESLLKLYEQALSTNRYFACAKINELLPGYPSIFPVFKKEVIQFYNDDLSDLYRNFNGVAADVFREVFKSSINDITINPSTMPAVVTPTPTPPNDKVNMGLNTLILYCLLIAVCYSCFA
ncbi:MAG: hypothetical protein FWC60_01840 [Firmicutes bacterium]|nr:hypothetical protein [Bacillota bacterium]